MMICESGIEAKRVSIELVAEAKRFSSQTHWNILD